MKHDEGKAFEMFMHLNEVNEICLGMSIGKPRGNGVGYKSARRIFDAIKDSTAFKEEIIDNLEDIRLFVDGIDKDRISDMTANIIKEPLLKYTKEQCDIYGAKLTNCETGYYWNKTCWERGRKEMIVYDSKNYLLVPKYILTTAEYYCKDQYYRHYILEEQKEYNLKNNTPLVKKKHHADGTTTSHVYKKDVHENNVSNYGNNSIDKNWVASFTKNNPGVLEKYRKEIIKKCIHDEVITNEDRIAIVDGLISELGTIKPGNKDAYRYHCLIIGILELLFYPSLICPKKEDKIYHGRKRVDITFDNAAETGLFFQLGTTKSITSRIIYIECKNYSNDISNPEIDQLSGRFSANGGKFGILCCRKVKDIDLLTERIKDLAKAKNEYILCFEDRDLTEMLVNFKNRVSNDEYLNQKLNKLFK